MGAGRAPSGRDIWKAVREELRLNLYPLPFSTIAPTVYHVYLHPEDYDAIEGVAATVVDQIRRALTAEVEHLNRDMGGRVKTILARLLERDRLAPIELPPGGWEVHVRRDPDGDLSRGQLGIVSSLALPAPAEYTGTPTTRIVRSVVSHDGRTSTVTHVPLPAGGVPPASSSAMPGVRAGREAGADVRGRPAGGAAGGGAPAGTPPAAAGTLSAAPGHPGAPVHLQGDVRQTDTRAARDRARLSYHDDNGAHTFVMRKDAIAIGRGGSAVWVDVQVLAAPRVSREHLRIRVDADGQFFVQDVSLWGTSVDDRPIPPAVKGPEGVAQPGPEHPLPPRARITLAGTLTIEFEALGAP